MSHVSDKKFLKLLKQVCVQEGKWQEDTIIHVLRALRQDSAMTTDQGLPDIWGPLFTHLWYANTNWCFAYLMGFYEGWVKYYRVLCEHQSNLYKCRVYRFLHYPQNTLIYRTSLLIYLWKKITGKGISEGRYKWFFSLAWAAKGNVNIALILKFYTLGGGRVIGVVTNSDVQKRRETSLALS